MAESVSVDVLAKVYGERDVAKLGDQFAKTAVTADAAAASLKVWNDTAVKSAKADQTLVTARNAHAKADKLLADAENVLAGKATATTRLLADQRAKTDDTAKSATGLAARFSALAGAGGGGMGALIGAGVALSPVLLTVGTGLAGLAAAAYGVARPIEKAAKASGGLQANMARLNPEQRRVAQGILALGKGYGAFQASLKPEVLGLFNTGLRIAGHLLHDVQPVATATGKALNQVLLSVDREFQSGTWQQFFAFMAKNAGPDTLLLGKTMTDLLQVIPPLTEDLQPLARAILLVGDDAAKATGGVVKFYDAFQRDVPFSNLHLGNALKDLDHWTVELTDHIPGAKAVNDWITGLQHGLTGTAAAGAKAAPQVQRMATVTGDLIHPLTVSAGQAGIFADNVGQSTAAAKKTIPELEAQARALNKVAGGYEHALTPLENYINATLTQYNDLHSLRQALQASGDKIGYKTQKERDSFAAAQTYIQNTIQQGNSALAAHKGIDAQITSIRNALPVLERVKGKTGDYKRELDLLKGILDKLRQERLIQEQVKVTGKGTWSVVGVGPFAGKPTSFAGGGKVPGYGGGDRYPALLEGGESVVPKHLTPAVAPFLKAQGVPGFAAGIVGSYGGSPGGLAPWTQNNQRATVTEIGVDIAKSMAASFKAAVQAVGLPAGHGAVGAGVRQWAPAASLALQLLGQPAADLGTVLSQMTTESGGNPYAVNRSDINWFLGHPSVGLMQVIGPTFAAYAGRYRNIGPFEYGVSVNPLANIYAGLNYAVHRYGPGWTSVLGHGHGYDSGGYLPPGLSLAYNGTGRPEMVLPSRGGAAARVVIEVRGNDSETSQFLVRLLKRHVRVAGGGNVQTAFATSR